MHHHHLALYYICLSTTICSWYGKSCIYILSMLVLGSPWESASMEMYSNEPALLTLIFRDIWSYFSVRELLWLYICDKLWRNSFLDVIQQNGNFDYNQTVFVCIKLIAILFQPNTWHEVGPTRSMRLYLFIWPSELVGLVLYIFCPKYDLFVWFHSIIFLAFASKCLQTFSYMFNNNRVA